MNMQEKYKRGNVIYSEIVTFLYTTLAWSTKDIYIVMRFKKPSDSKSKEKLYLRITFWAYSSHVGPTGTTITWRGDSQKGLQKKLKIFNVDWDPFLNKDGTFLSLLLSIFSWNIQEPHSKHSPPAPYIQ